MKFLVLVAIIAVALAEEDLEKAIADPQKLQGLVDCFLDRAPCSPAPAKLKEITPKAVASNCANCTTAQKHIAKLFFTNLQQNLPQEYDNFVQKYDPKGEYMDSFLKSVQGA
ncbi:allergen Tha p 1-like [Pieris napi]|uniref:allergen Tha p 1-like n=1 Tax=Pieris napi TaxID=78633 RepID=UPI001FB8DB80|nr:allergen Tha p 1-like [Pieris napi]